MENTTFYFSLPRLLSKGLAGRSHRSEGTSLEAHAGSLIIFAITYFFFVDFGGAHLTGWKMSAAYLIFAVAVWIFWLVVLYLNSVLIEAGHLFGLFRTTPNRRVQDFLVGLLLTLFAIELWIGDSWRRWVGVGWLAFLSLNVAAAVLLGLFGARAATD